jgi:hypothetical protein
MHEGGFDRKNSPHHQSIPPADLTPGGIIIWHRTRRPIATCNAIAEIAGIGVGRAA